MCFYLVSCWYSHDNECGLVSNLCQRKGVKHMSASFCICSSNHGESWKKIEYFLACDHGVCQVPKSNDNMLYLYPCQAQGLMFTSTWSQSVYALPCQAQGLTPWSLWRQAYLFNVKLIMECYLKRTAWFIMLLIASCIFVITFKPARLLLICWSGQLTVIMLQGW